MGPPGTANGRIRARKVGYDLQFRQNGQYNGIFGKTVPFLTLRDDVIEGSPHPKLNGYQQGTPGGAVVFVLVVLRV